MASDAEMASYIADMLNPLGEVRIKRMFGEYCFYVNEKPVGFLCDNEVLVKTNAEMRALHPEMPQKLLFDGAVNPMCSSDLLIIRMIAKLLNNTSALRQRCFRHPNQRNRGP